MDLFDDEKDHKKEEEELHVRIRMRNTASCAKINQDMINVIETHSTGICSFRETKKKDNDNISICKNILIESGIEKHKKAQAGVRILLK